MLVLLIYKLHAHSHYPARIMFKELFMSNSGLRTRDLEFSVNSPRAPPRCKAVTHLIIVATQWVWLPPPSPHPAFSVNNSIIYSRAPN